MRELAPLRGEFNLHLCLIHQASNLALIDGTTVADHYLTCLLSFVGIVSWTDALVLTCTCVLNEEHVEDLEPRFF